MSDKKSKLVSNVTDANIKDVVKTLISKVESFETTLQKQKEVNKKVIDEIENYHKAFDSIAKLLDAMNKSNDMVFTAFLNTIDKSLSALTKEQALNKELFIELIPMKYYISKQNFKFYKITSLVTSLDVN